MVDPLLPGRTSSPRRSSHGAVRQALLGGAVLLSATAGWFAYDRLVRQPQAARRAAEALQTVTVTTADLSSSTEASGVVNAVRKVTLSPNVASRIDRLYIREGDRVVAGQLIAEMESEPLQAKTNQVKAQLEAAKANRSVAGARRSRHEPLLASGAISLELMEELRNEERQAEIKVQEAEFQLKETQAELRNAKVFAPFAGIITRQFAQAGQFVTPTTTASVEAGATSTSIAELSSGLEVVAKLPEASLTEIRVGQRAQINTDAFPGDVFQGRVALVSPRAVIENEVNSFPVSVSIETGLGKLKPAMNVQVRFLAEPIRGALALPLAALTTGENDRRGVLRRKRDGSIEFVPVTVGRISGERVQIVKGLSRGDRVLISAPPADVKIPGYMGSQ